MITFRGNLLKLPVYFLSNQSLFGQLYQCFLVRALHTAKLYLPESGVGLHDGHNYDIDKNNDTEKIAVVPADLFLHVIVFDHKVNFVICDKQKGIRVCKDEVCACHDKVFIGQVQVVHPWNEVWLEVPDVNHLETAAQA